jgi:hypothetical protein
MKSKPVLKLMVEVTREGSATAADYRVQFVDFYGAKVKAIVRFPDCQSELSPEKQHLTVGIIRSFDRLSHVRLPDGRHCHVSNDLLVQVPQ